ncbi:MAG TPA: hypothetical protein VFT22_41960 [Kofleriaceae bacterium]|nr:hypothetical protein [Kofleriaceae bacterium]
MLRLAFMVSLAGCLGRLDNTGAECRADGDCVDGDLCTRNNVCVEASRVRAVQVNWTVNGQPASRTACAASADLENLQVDLDAPDTEINPHLAFSPVPCEEGRFNVDKLPTSFDRVRVGNRPLGWQSARLDAVTGEATLDLVSASGSR